ncbi:uncharacterized protein [Mytilus edulis]|uniref:uncharacterized protein n=1 Tax=Mytilus edulis TaxID=6550 RepID=UPI0039F01A02
MDLQQSIHTLNDEILLHSQYVQEFHLPLEYHDMQTTDMDLQQSIHTLKDEILLHSQYVQEFHLPLEYHDNKTDSISSCCYSTLHTSDKYKLNKAVSALKDEVCYQSTIIRDFNLPFKDLVDERELQQKYEARLDVSRITPNIEKCSKPQKKSKQNKSTRMSRVKDKERKRKQRNLKKQLEIPCETSQPIDEDLYETKWQKMYTENVSYREHKKSYSEEKYNLDLQNKQVKIDQIKTKYRQDIKFQQEVRDRSNKKYQSDTKFKEEVKDRSKMKYQSNEEFQRAVKERSKTKYHLNKPFQTTLKERSITKYLLNKKFKQAVKDRSKSKYHANEEFQQTVKDRSKSKYHANEEFQQTVKERSKSKYHANEEFQQTVKERSKSKYHANEEFQQTVKERSKSKYHANEEFQQAVKERSKTKYRLNIQFQKAMSKASRHKYAFDRTFREQKKTLTRLRYRQNVLLREKYKRRLRQQYKYEMLIMRQKKISMILQRRLNKKQYRDDIANYFRQQVRDGPRYVCSVCHKFKFRKQVVVCDKLKYSKKGDKSIAMANQCITQQFHTTCSDQCQSSCETIFHKQWICFTCHYHLLKGQMPADAFANGLQLPPIPDELNSLNKLEKQLISVRIPFMKIIQLPKGNQKGFIGPCVSIPTDIEKTTNVLPRSENEAELIRCKLKRKLEYKGYCQYEFVSRKKICKGLEYLQQNNPYYHDKLLNDKWIEHIPSDFKDLVTEEAELTEVLPEEHAKDDKNHDDEDISFKDKGLPSDTCLQPVDLGQEILDQHFEDIFCVAPGEGNTPVSMLQEHGNEAMSFPVQFPEGSFGSYDAKRLVPLTRSRYFHARLFNADTRFSGDTSYIFYAQYLSELEQVISKVSIALRKSSGKDKTGNIITARMLTDKNQLKRLLTTDQGYKFMTPIRGTPPYWQATLRDLMASIRQLGIPTWFATFSAADFRWKETLQVLLEQQKSTQSLEDLDWTGKSELLQYNPVMSAVMFDHRFNTFLKEILIKKYIIGNVKDHFHRIEFQQRGSPHAHCLFWIKDAPLLDTHDDKEVCDFVDSYVTCDLPSESADPELHEIVSSVQQHSKKHSKSCAKKGTECRFNFPRPPSTNTFISRSSTQSGPSVQKPSKERISFAKDILLRLWKTVNNTNIENITTENLFIAAGITQEEFETASNVLTKRTTVTIKRKPADIWINQYNPTLLRCWNANMDLQYITDAYSCVMYIISYISKAEREMGLVLENARKEAAEGNCDAQDAMKKIGGAYFRQREVSAQEATYRACGLHLKESSRKVQFLPVGDNQVKMSLPLNIIQMKANQSDHSIWMHSLYDRYKARPVSFQFDILCYASFSSDYRVLSPSQIPKKTSQYVFELQNDLGYIRKHSRTDSAIVAYPRFSKIKNPELYFKSSLQLFLPHRFDDQLKPLKFKTYQEMYLNGAVSLDSSKEPQQVKTIVESNRHLFEQNADELDEAQDLLEKQGPLEDAWALIAPESEAERLEAQVEKEHLDDEDGSEIPDLDILNKKVRKGTDFEVRQSIFTCQQIQHLLRQLNIEQKRVFYQIRQWCLDKVNGKNPHPFKVFINGGAGTGKSHLIKCLCYETNKILSPHAPNPDDIVVLITAPTATAAFNIGGTTLHQAFSLSKSLPFPYIYKRDDEINKLRTKLQNLQILIIDEISMVGQRVLLYISERLRQIKQSGNALFGNICVIAVGDFYQLPPVKQKCLYDLRPEHFFPLWSLNFSLVELNQIMRQKEDSEFAQLLNRLRVKKKTEHLLPRDLSVLKSCMQHSVPLDSLHIFATNKEIDSHNSKMIDKVCEETVTIIRRQVSLFSDLHHMTVHMIIYHHNCLLDQTPE